MYVVQILGFHVFSEMNINTFSAGLGYFWVCYSFCDMGPENSVINALQPSLFFPQHFWKFPFIN